MQLDLHILSVLIKLHNSEADTAREVTDNNMGDEGKVDDLLSTLRIPVYPPDRKQWKKLELAVKFINKSKTSVRHAKERKESLKLQPKDLKVLVPGSDDGEPDPDHLQLGHDDDNQGSYAVISSTRRKESNWSKIRQSLHKIM